MSNVSTYSALNELLINMGRCLLQYVGECWPWTDPNTLGEQQRIEELVQQQQHQVASLADLLNAAEWTIDFGTYPTEYTDLHYVALDFLLNQVVQNQQGLAEQARTTRLVCQGHTEAETLLSEIQTLQASIAQSVQSLIDTPAPSESA